MAKELLSEELWKTIEPLLPDEAPKPKGGRPRVENLSALAGIIFVFKSAIRWEMLPKEMGCGSGLTCSGEAYATGKRQACGRGCTKSFWTASERPTE